jgi:hypothetical protein
MDPAYTLPTHCHRFAAWAASRAAQRGCKNATTARLIKALEIAGAPNFIPEKLQKINSAVEYSEFHHKICNRILDAIKDHCSNFGYGRAAKLLAIYLKSMVIIVPDFMHPVRELIHPPIDSILLKRLLKDKPNLSKKIELRRRWTKINEMEYFELIHLLQQVGLDKPQFWMLERYWVPSDEE